MLECCLACLGQVLCRQLQLQQVPKFSQWSCHTQKALLGYGYLQPLALKILLPLSSTEILEPSVRDGAGWCGMVQDGVGWCGMVRDDTDVLFVVKHPTDLILRTLIRYGFLC